MTNTDQITGQLKVKESKILIVGAGGLGCPAAAYLAGAGVGTLGLVDGDTVEESNLHRQIAHANARVGMKKVDSAVIYLSGQALHTSPFHTILLTSPRLNPHPTYNTYPEHLTPQNAAQIFASYDIILDCTDHPTSRYLISDTCVLLSKPLVSASAFQTSGQLIVLNFPPGKGPCYRCVFPKPPPPNSVIGCGEGGILGPIVGTMGVLQALEAIKLIIRGKDPKKQDTEVKSQTMLLFGGMDDTPFRSVRMRGKRKDCFACGDESTFSLKVLEESMDYVQFCGVVQPVNLLKPEERISAIDYGNIVNEKKDHILLDVREKEHFGMASLEGALNLPINLFTRRGKGGGVPDWVTPEVADPNGKPVYVVCRVGNDSQIAAKALKEMGLDQNGARFIGDIEGGMRAWKSKIDPSIPFV